MMSDTRRFTCETSEPETLTLEDVNGPIGLTNRAGACPLHCAYRFSDALSVTGTPPAKGEPVPFARVFHPVNT